MTIDDCPERVIGRPQNVRGQELSRTVTRRAFLVALPGLGMTAPTSGTQPRVLRRDASGEPTQMPRAEGVELRGVLETCDPEQAYCFNFGQALTIALPPDSAISAGLQALVGVETQLIVRRA